jgi:hypothetical protein
MTIARPVRIDHGVIARMLETAIDQIEGVDLIRRGQIAPAEIGTNVIARIIGIAYDPEPRVNQSDEDVASLAVTYEVTCPEAVTTESAYAIESAVARVVAAIDEYAAFDDDRSAEAEAIPPGDPTGHYLELKRCSVDVSFDTGGYHQMLGATIIIQGRASRNAGQDLEDHHV